MEKLEQTPDNIVPVYVDAVAMPNGEVICLGKRIGSVEEMKGFLYIKE